MGKAGLENECPCLDMKWRCLNESAVVTSEPKVQMRRTKGAGTISDRDRFIHCARDNLSRDQQLVGKKGARIEDTMRRFGRTRWVICINWRGCEKRG